MKTLIIIVVLLLVTIGGFAYAGRNTLYNELNTLKLIPEPERFTELYFDDSASLPRNTVKGEPVSFSFTVHNVEGATTTYPYRVYFQDPSGDQQTLTTGTVSLADGASTAIPVSIIYPVSNARGMFVVDLTALNQSIDFLVPNTN